MLTRDDIDHLATLARLEVSDEEKIAFATALAPILAYVSDVSGVETTESGLPPVGVLRNVMRRDDAPRAGGTFTDAILKNAPRSEDGYVRVKQIF